MTPSPVNPLGVKGVGEAGTIGCSPAVVNSVVDALSPLGRAAHRHAADAGENLEADAAGGQRMIPQDVRIHRSDDAGGGAGAAGERRARSWPAA